VEDASVFLAEALIERDNLGSHPLVHRHVRHGRQQPAVTQLSLKHKKGECSSLTTLYHHEVQFNFNHYK
jgi:hypothetical protein